MHGNCNSGLENGEVVDEDDDYEADTEAGEVDVTDQYGGMLLRYGRGNAMPAFPGILYS